LIFLLRFTKTFKLYSNLWSFLGGVFISPYEPKLLVFSPMWVIKDGANSTLLKKFCQIEGFIKSQKGVTELTNKHSEEFVFNTTVEIGLTQYLFRPKQSFWDLQQSSHVNNIDYYQYLCLKSLDTNFKLLKIKANLMHQLEFKL